MKINKSSLKLNNNFVKYYGILLISAIIPVFILVLIIYQQTTSIVQKQSRESTLNMLDKTRQSVDLVLKQINEKMIQVIDNGDIPNNVLDEANNNKFEKNIELLNVMRNAVSNSEFITSIYIYSDTDKSVMTSDGGRYDIDGFYDKGWLGQYYNLFHGTTSYRGIYQLDTRKTQDMWGNEHNDITLICGLPYGLEKKEGGIILNISEEKLYNVIGNRESNGDLFVINSEGYVISHKDSSSLYSNVKYLNNFNRLLTSDQGYFVEKVQGSRELYTFVTSTNTGWKYVYKIPLPVLYDNKYYIAQIIGIVTLFYFLVSLVIFFFVSRKMYKPILNLMKIVSGTVNESGEVKGNRVPNEYEFLGKMYSDVMDTNKDMKSMIESMKPLMIEKLFNSILLGNIIDFKEIMERFSLLDINLNSPNFIVFVMQIDNFARFQKNNDEIDRSIQRIRFVKLVESLIPDEYTGVCYETGSDKFVSIINFPENQGLIEEQERVMEVIKDIKNAVEKELPFTVTVGIGRICSGIEKIKTSYNEAVRALKYKIYQGKNEIINILSINHEPEELYSYLSEKQPLIVNNLKIGNYAEIEKIVNEMFDEITHDKKPSYEYIQTVLTKVINSILELIVNYRKTVKEIFSSERDLYKELMEKETIDEIRVWLLEICKEVARSINDLQITHFSKNIEKVLEFIDQNLHKEISLRDVADCIGLSSGYVSSLFKEHLGKNYIDYLNGMRIDRAKKLLKETRINISEVGFRVGFNNVQTFLRTFKKYEGVTPGQFRDSL